MTDFDFETMAKAAAEWDRMFSERQTELRVLHSMIDSAQQRLESTRCARARVGAELITAQEEFTTARDRATAASVTKTKVHGHDVSRGSDGVSGPPPVVAFAALTSRIDSAANQLMWATPLGRRAAHKSALRAELTEKLKSFSESLDESADDEGVKSSKSSKSMSKSQRGVVEAAAAAEAEAVRIGHRVAFARKQATLELRLQAAAKGGKDTPAMTPARAIAERALLAVRTAFAVAFSGVPPSVQAISRDALRAELNALGTGGLSDAVFSATINTLEEDNFLMAVGSRIYRI